MFLTSMSAGLHMTLHDRVCVYVDTVCVCVCVCVCSVPTRPTLVWCRYYRYLFAHHGDLCAFHFKVITCFKVTLG